MSTVVDNIGSKNVFACVIIGLKSFFNKSHIFNKGAVMNKVVAVAQLALCFVLMFSISSTGQNRPSALVGQWVLVENGFDDGLDDDMELLSDGTAMFAADDKKISGSWKIVDKRFIVSALGQGLSYYYKLSGFELYLSDDDDLTSAYNPEDDGYGALYVKKGNLKDYEKKKEAELEGLLNGSYKLLEKDGKGKYISAKMGFERVLRESKDSEKIKKAKEGLERIRKESGGR